MSWSSSFLPPQRDGQSKCAPAILSALAKITIFQMQETAGSRWTKETSWTPPAGWRRWRLGLLDLGEHQLARAALLEAGGWPAQWTPFPGRPQASNPELAAIFSTPGASP